MSATTGAARILAERQRQIEVKGWTPEHDAEHDSCELAMAASSYLLAARHPNPTQTTTPIGPWPWHAEWWKPSDDPIRNLVKAGALIAAEIDRLQRLTVKAAGG